MEPLEFQLIETTAKVAASRLRMESAGMVDSATYSYNGAVPGVDNETGDGPSPRVGPPSGVHANPIVHQKDKSVTELA